MSVMVGKYVVECVGWSLVAIVVVRLMVYSGSCWYSFIPTQRKDSGRLQSSL